MNIKDFEIFKQNSFEKKIINGLEYNLNKQPYLDVVLNDSCNQNCKFCIADLIHEKIHLDLETAKTKIKYAVESLNVKDILILGGEPTLSPILIDVIKYCKTLPQIEKIIMTTNGKRLRDFKFAYKIYKAGLTNLNISFMNLDHQKRKEINGTPNPITLDELEEIIKTARECNVDVRINCNIFKNNVNSFDSMLAFYHEMKKRLANSIKFSPLCTVGNFSVVSIKTEWVNQNIMTAEEYQKLFDKFENYFNDMGFNIIENSLQFGFVKNTLIPLRTPIIMNWNFGDHTGMMDKVTRLKQINNIKLLPTGDLSLSWNREDVKWIIL